MGFVFHLILSWPRPISNRLQLISRVMCGVSTSLRFPGQLNGYDIIRGWFRSRLK